MCATFLKSDFLRKLLLKTVIHDHYFGCDAIESELLVRIVYKHTLGISTLKMGLVGRRENPAMPMEPTKIRLLPRDRKTHNIIGTTQCHTAPSNGSLIV